MPSRQFRRPRAHSGLSQFDAVFYFEFKFYNYEVKSRMHINSKVRKWGNGPDVASVAHQEKQRRILREAGAVFGEVGYHNATMELIAKRLGLTKAALYYYFTDKSQILLRCFDLGFEVAEAALDAALALDARGLDRFALFVERYVEGIVASLGACAAGIELRSAPPAEMPGVLKKSRAFDRRLRDLVQEGIDDRSIATTDPALAVNWVMGATTLLPRWYRANGRYSGLQVAKAYGDLARRMLSAPATAAPGCNPASP